MKQRTTYLVTDADATQPDNFILNSDSLHIKSLHAAREDRLTIPHNELPPELAAVLKLAQSVTVRWSTPRAYESVDPYASRVPAGLHVLVSGSSEGAKDQICSVINPAFGINDCEDAAFVDVPGGASLFYAPVEDVAALHSYLAGVVEEAARVSSLLRADYVDFTYDNSTRNLVVNTFWSRGAAGEAVTERREGAEVGIFGHSRPMDDDSFTLGGVVHVVGKDDRLDPVLFTFASRHFRHSGKFTLDIPQPTGLHPKLRLELAAGAPPADGCTLNAYFTLPRGLFVDQYQLSPANPQLLQELGIRKLREIRGETDLEAPVWAGKRWGSALVVELEPGAAVAELPVHLRYLEPSTDGEGYRLLKFPEPALFWACDAGVGEWEKSPFERARVGWEGWFEERTLFWDLTPKDGGWGEVRVPVVEARYGGVVRWGTMVAVVAGFAWVCWKVVGAGRVAKEEVEKKKQ